MAEATKDKVFIVHEIDEDLTERKRLLVPTASSLALQTSGQDIITAGEDMLQKNQRFMNSYEQPIRVDNDRRRTYDLVFERSFSDSSRDTDSEVEDVLPFTSLDVVGAEDTRVRQLPRGGFYIDTAIGAIQFGIPNDSVKDCMDLGIDVPSMYLLPDIIFDKRRAINCFEFEFPTYFNFFLKGKPVTIICTDRMKERVKAIYQETIFGPEELSFESLRSEYPDWINEEDIPDLKKECFGLRDEGLALEKLVSFHCLEPSDQKGVYGAWLQGTDNPNDTLEIYYSQNTHTFFIQDKAKDLSVREDESKFEGLDEQGKNDLIASFYDKRGPRIELSIDLIFEPPNSKHSNNSDVELSYSTRKLLHLDNNDSVGIEYDFRPPSFGVTTLGNSHGFDPHGHVSSFILWINGSGILVDPHVDTDQLLKSNGIAPRLIKGIILTHCHADHDAGTFRMILKEQRIKLFTTRTIYNSFIRKYAAITGFKQKYVRFLCSFVNISLKSEIPISGGHLIFDYSLHTIPCVGFAAYYGYKSIRYSGDHCNSRVIFDRLRDKGYISEGRYNNLCNFDWSNDIIIHELGVPPIHTPAQTLIDLPQDIKDRLYIIHCSDKEIPVGSGLRKVQVGVEHTISIEPAVTKPHADAIRFLSIFSSMELFEALSFRESSLLLQLGEVLSYPKGHEFSLNSDGDRYFCIVFTGWVEATEVIMKKNDEQGISALQAIQRKMIDEEDDYDSDMAGFPDLTPKKIQRKRKRKKGSQLRKRMAKRRESMEDDPFDSFHSIPTRRRPDKRKESKNSSEQFIRDTLSSKRDHSVRSRRITMTRNTKVSYLSAGDIFGSACYLLLQDDEDEREEGSYRALTRCEVLKVSRRRWISYFGSSKIMRGFNSILVNQTFGFFDTVFKNDLLRGYSEAKLNFIASLCDYREWNSNESIWRPMDLAQELIIISEGKFSLDNSKTVVILERGKCVGEVHRILKTQRNDSQLLCIENGAGFVINKSEIEDLFLSFPGAMMDFLYRTFV